MSVPINQESLLGALTPDVFIEAISLETAGNPYEKDDPHTDDHPLERRHTAASPSESLTVSIDVSLKEVLGNDLIGSWLQEAQFQKYLKIKVIQSTDEEITSILSQNQNAIRLTSDDNSYLHSPLLGKMGYASSDARKNIMARLRASTQRQELSIAAAMSNKASTRLFRSSVELADSGSRIYNFSFRARFTIPIENPEHLAYFALSYIDLAAVQADFGLSVDVASAKEQNGKVSSEIVIDNYRVVSTASVFKTVEGEIWAGPVHRGLNNSWLTGTKSTKSPMPLSKSLVPNAKVHDFRISRRAESIDLGLLGTTNDEIMRLLNPPATTANSMTVMSLTEKDNYFSELLISRDPDGSSRIFFGINFMRALENNSLFGRILQHLDEGTQREIIQSSDIVSARLSRKRVKRTRTANTLGALSPSTTVFDANIDPQEVLVSASGNEINSETDIASFKEVGIATVSASPQASEVRYFTGMDKTVSSKTDGAYTYGVVLQIKDGVKGFLLSTIADLKSDIEALKEYKIVASAPGMTKGVLAANPHIDHEGEASAVEIGLSRGNFSLISGRFTSNFADTMNEKYPEFKVQPWNKSITDFIYILKMFGAKKTTPIAKGFFSMINPTTGSIPGLIHFISLCESLVRSLESLVGTEESSSPHSSSKSYVPANPVDKTFQITKWFDSNFFDSNVRKYFGYDYLSSMAFTSRDKNIDHYNTDGLKLLEAERWTQRVAHENGKWFSDPTSTVSLIAGNMAFIENMPVSQNDYMFLSPSTIFLGSEEDVFYNDLRVVDYEKASNVVATLYGYTSTQGGRVTPSPPDNKNMNYEDRLTASLASFGATLQRPDAALPQPLVYLSPEDPALSIGNTLSILDTVDPEIEIVVPDKCHKGEVLAGAPVDAPVPTADKNNVVANAFLRDFVGPFVRFQRAPNRVPHSVTQTIADYDLNVQTCALRAALDQELVMPNQVLSLAAPSVNGALPLHNFFDIGGDFVRDPKYSAVYDLNIGLLNAVEYFDGFREDMLQNGKKALKKLSIQRSSWKPLTREDYLKSKGDLLLCRMRGYTSAVLGLTRPAGIDLPAYDGYFFIRSPRQGLRSSQSIRALTEHILKEMWSSISLIRGEYITSNIIT